MEKGHYGEYSGNAKHSRVTASNYKASERDDAAHIDYLKRDVLYDNHHSHSDAAMTADEKHISHLAGDMKYDKKHHGMSRESADLKDMVLIDIEKGDAEGDMKRGMSRKEDGNAKALREQVENYPRPMPTDAPKQFTQQAYKRLGKSYANEGNVGMPTDEYVKSKYEEYRDGSTGSQAAPGFEARDGMSRKSRSERLRGIAVKLSEREGEGQGGYDYENPRVMNMLNKATMLDERSGANNKYPMSDGSGKKVNMTTGSMSDERSNERSNELRDNEVNRMMDERSDGMNRMSKYGGNKHDYHRHMDAQGHMTKDGVVGGGKYGKGGHYKDYEGMSRDSYGMERKSCGTKYTGVSRYSSPAAFMGIKRPGRCTPFPNPDCEPGTPQYNLAKRLKPGGDLYKGKKK